jgi:hypothetical protein
MSIPETEDILYAAGKLAPFLDAPFPEQIEAMIVRVGNGEARTNQLLDLIVSAGQYQRAWMRAALLGEVDERLLGESSLPGNPNSIPANSVWLCKHGDFEWVVRRAGQPVPPCPHHKIALLRQP